MNEKTLNTIANSSDIKSALEIMIKQNEEIVRIGNEKALEVIATQSIMKLSVNNTNIGYIMTQMQ